MKKFSLLFCLIAAMALIFPFSVNAAQPKSRTETIEVRMSEYSDMYSPDEKIVVEGITYALKDFKITDTTLETFTVTKENLSDKSYKAPEETFNPSDKAQTGKLLKTEFSENKESGKTKSFSETVKETKRELNYSLPNTRKTTYKDEETGETIDVTLKLVSSERSNPYWYEIDGLSGTVTGYDALFYSLKGSDVQIPKNDEYPEYRGYKEAILKSLGLGSEYRIIGSSWKGKAYTNSKGVLCRDCVYQAEKKVCDVSGVYSAEVTRPDVITYTATSTYEDESHSFYTITANYEAVKKKTPIAAVISVVIGLLILAALISAILVFLSKKKDKKQQRIKKI